MQEEERARAIDAAQLSLRGVSLRFGGIVALDQVSFDIPPGRVVGLIGPNGAGKTTLFNCITRLYPVDAGSIRLEHHELTSLPAHAIAALGVSRTFQNLALFRSLSVRENIMLGGHATTRSGFFRNALRLPLVRREEAGLRTHADELLEQLDLRAVADHPAAGLPMPVQKRVELARALAARPRLLLLDEPAGGLNHEDVVGLGQLVRDLSRRLGLTVLLVEHHMNLVMGISDYVVVLNFGSVIAQGPPAQVQRDAEVIRAYLGDRRAA